MVWDVAVRLADLLAGLSRMADAGFGLPMGSAARSCVLATRLAHALELSPAEVQATYYTALLHHVGCVGYAHETVQLFGDDLAVNRAAGRTNVASSRDTFGTFLPELMRGHGRIDRARLAFTALARGGRWGDRFTATACEIGRESARRLGLPEAVETGLYHVFDLWRRPGRRPTEEIPIAARVARLAGVAVLFDSVGGPSLAVESVRRRRGGMLDPALVATFAHHAAQWLADDAAAADVLLELEPRPHVTVPDARGVAEFFGDLADLKSPFFVGHSRGVAELAVGAARRLRLPAAAETELAVAGLLHDVGRVAVSTAIWEKPGRLTTDEWEQVRLHPYRSERILTGSAALAPLAALAGRHHERLDGSGYHRGCAKDDLSLPARVLAAADTYRTLTEDRPHRTALEPGQAQGRLMDAAAQGVLDPDAVAAVLATAGSTAPLPAAKYPLGLSAREVEVLRLVAKGSSNADIAARLVISRRTAEHHVQHIYSKIGVSSRAAATLFAVEHDLLDRNG
jgi:HD-GYP domain-containing protein (c-di-GMP phosphodiesterase class II)/DNA-binding CsgD family transcriptional regulator